MKYKQLKLFKKIVLGFKRSPKFVRRQLMKTDFSMRAVMTSP
jgi:hypothetical protein